MHHSSATIAALTIASSLSRACAHTAGSGHSHPWRYAHDVSHAFGAPASAAPGAPEQIWINYGHAPTDMVVSWTTSLTCNSTVRYGTAPGVLTSFASGNASAYNASFGAYTSGLIHHTTLPNLPLRARIYDQVAGPGGSWGDVQSFIAPRGVGVDGGYPYRLGVIGDIGQTNNSNATANWLLGGAADVESVVIAGDLRWVHVGYVCIACRIEHFGGQ